MSVAVFGMGVVLAQMGGFVRRGGGLHCVFHGLRIHALVYASAQETARGTFGNFLPAQRPSSVASSLYAEKFQRRPAAGRLVPGNIADAFEDRVRAGAMSIPAQRPTTAHRKSVSINPIGSPVEVRLPDGGAGHFG